MFSPCIQLHTIDGHNKNRGIDIPLISETVNGADAPALVYKYASRWLASSLYMVMFLPIKCISCLYAYMLPEFTSYAYTYTYLFCIEATISLSSWVRWDSDAQRAASMSIAIRNYSLFFICTTVLEECVTNKCVIDKYKFYSVIRYKDYIKMIKLWMKTI